MSLKSDQLELGLSIVSPCGVVAQMDSGGGGTEGLVSEL